MEWIPWTSVLATGHAILDTDHEHLVALFHQLAKLHFAFEEQLMFEQNFPKTDQHTAEHARLIEQAIRFRAKFEADTPGSHISLIHFPEDWLTLHILTADRQFANFLCATAENLSQGS